MVDVGAAGRPGGNIAGLEQGLAIVLDQHRLARQHDHHLVLAVVPVALRRPGARVKAYPRRPKRGEASDRTEPLLPAPGNIAVERRGIAGPVGLFDRIHVDLGHSKLLC